jgi:hypothetical protein
VRYALLTPFRILHVCIRNPFQRASQQNRSDAPLWFCFRPFHPPPYHLINGGLPYLESPAVLSCPDSFCTALRRMHYLGPISSRPNPLPVSCLCRILVNSILANPLLALITSSSLLESSYDSCLQLYASNFHSLTHPDDARHSLHLLN